MDHAMDSDAYGLWGLVVLNSVIIIGFAFSFFKPKTNTDWRSFGAFSAFIIALFVEMYGFPLSIFLLSGWLAAHYPGVDFLSHDNGHLIHTLLGLKDNPHFDIFHILSNVFIFGGFLMLSYSWHVLWKRSAKGNSPPPASMPTCVTHNLRRSSSLCWGSCCNGQLCSPS